MLVYEGRAGKRSWEDVALAFRSMPNESLPRFVMDQNNSNRVTALHIAASCAPKHIVDQLLLLAPKAIHALDKNGSLPLHIAIREKNKDGSRCLVWASPQHLLSCDSYDKSAFSYADEKMKHIVVQAFDMLLSKLKDSLLASGSSAAVKPMLAAWNLLCTVTKEEPGLEYFDSRTRVSRLLDGLGMSEIKFLGNHVKILSAARRPLPQIVTPACAAAILEHYRFQRRYEICAGHLFSADRHIILRAKEKATKELYEKVMFKFTKQAALPFNDEAFCAFITALKIDIDVATLRIREIGENGNNSFNIVAFDEFCDEMSIDDSGVRNIALQFIKDEAEYKRELEIRELLTPVETQAHIVPILDHFYLDEKDKSFFSEYIFKENKILGNHRPADLDSFKYVLVMPEPGRSLDTIIRYEYPVEVIVDEIVDEIVERFKIFYSKGMYFLHLRFSRIRINPSLYYTNF